MKKLKPSMMHPLFLCSASALCFFLFTAKASAYAGLGPLVPMIGNGIVLLFMFVLTFIGAVTYPLRIALKKLFHKKRSGHLPKK